MVSLLFNQFTVAVTLLAAGRLLSRGARRGPGAVIVAFYSRHSGKRPCPASMRYRAQAVSTGRQKAALLLCAFAKWRADTEFVRLLGSTGSDPPTVTNTLFVG